MDMTGMTPIATRAPIAEAAPPPDAGAGPTTRHISCNACGADRFVPLSSVDGWTIGRCRTCGLVYVDPAPFYDPTPLFSEMSRTFEYTEYMHQPVTPGILAFERRQLLANAGELAGMEVAADGSAEGSAGGTRPAGERSPGGPLRFLDIGCGSGASVRGAMDLGWEAIGIDIDPELVREGRETLGADLRCVSILDSGLRAGTFDFVKLRDVVEHLPNPRDALATVGTLLAPGGVVLVVTPNEGGLATQARVMLGRRRTLVATVPPPHHLHSFGPLTLDRTLRRAGLRPARTFTTRPTNWRYVTSHNMARAEGRPLLRPLWRVGEAVGMGAVLVSWATADR
jgi:2-polyprenyl-3-methyl-5-hydroxy-6-metoxy-1,4-benzoquinol methylase